MSVRGPWRIKGDDRPLWVRVCTRAKENARESERGIGEQAPTVRQGWNRMEGAIDQPIRINEEEAFRLHNRSVAQAERRAGVVVARSSARAELGVATTTAALNQQEANEKASATDDRERGEPPLLVKGLSRLKGIRRLLIRTRRHCGSLR